MVTSTSLLLEPLPEALPEVLDAEVLRAPLSLTPELLPLLEPDRDLLPSDPGSLLEPLGLTGGRERRRPRDIFLHCQKFSKVLKHSSIFAQQIRSAGLRCIY